MPKVFLAPLLVAGLLLLPGCSSAEDKACEAAQKAHNDFYNEAGEYNGKAVLKITPESERKQLMQYGRNAYYRSQKVILNNPSCFTPEQLVEAQIYVD